MSLYDLNPPFGRPYYACRDLSVSRVHRHHVLPFYRLIQEQAAQHASAIEDHDHERELADKLYRTAITEEGINAFLVLRGDVPLAAVTYTKCQTERGSGLYLEDIVTTRAARGHGVGRFAMSVLSQITRAHGYHYLLWECAQNNQSAQKFYTDLKASICADRHTFRFEGLAGGSWPAHQSEFHLYRPLEIRDIPEACGLMRQAHEGAPHLESWLAQKVKEKNRDTVFMVCCDKINTQVKGFAYGYRSYSTFRMVNGLHINGLFVDQDHSMLLGGFLGCLSDLQERQGWIGHTDITVQSGQGRLQGNLASRGYEPLAYGESKMAVRSFDVQTLSEVASLCSLDDVTEIMRLPSTKPLAPMGRNRVIPQQVSL